MDENRKYQNLLLRSIWKLMKVNVVVQAWEAEA